MWKERSTQETWVLDGINANRDLEHAGFSHPSGFRPFSSWVTFTSILQIWLKGFNMKEPHLCPFAGKQQRKTKTKTRSGWLLCRRRRKPRSLIKFYKMRTRAPFDSLPRQSLFGACNSAKRQKHKENPQQDSKDIVGVSEDCITEAEKNWRMWVKSNKVSPQPGGLLHCPAIEWLYGSHDTVKGTVMNDSTAHPRYPMKSHLFPYLCSFQLQVSSSYLLTQLRHSVSQNMSKELLRLECVEMIRIHVCPTPTICLGPELGSDLELPFHDLHLLQT